MRQELQPPLNPRAKRFWTNTSLIAFILLTLSVMGAGLNYQVMHANGDKMPVYDRSGSFFTDSTKHFVVTEPSQAKDFYLGDVFQLGILYFSIGDVILVGSAIGIFIVLICAVKFKYFNKLGKRAMSRK